MRMSPLIKTFQGNKLVGLAIHEPNATDTAPDLFELEIVRIFNEYQELKAENDYYKTRSVPVGMGGLPRCGRSQRTPRAGA